MDSNKIYSWGRVLLERLIIVQLVKKFPTYYGSYRVHKITPIDPILNQMNPVLIISLRSILNLSSLLRLGHPGDLIPSGFPSNILYATLISPKRVTYSTFLILLDSVRVCVMKFFIMQVLPRFRNRLELLT